MNEIEAIELLRNMLPEKVSYANLVGASNCYGDKYVYENPEPYAIELAISALEKQIPKKPHGVDGFHNSEHCEICEKELYEKYNYCPECGQALDWSEDDE